MNDRGKQTVERCHLYYFEHYEGLGEDKTISIDTATLKVFKSQSHIILSNVTHDINKPFKPFKNFNLLF